MTLFYLSNTPNKGTEPNFLGLIIWSFLAIFLLKPFVLLEFPSAYFVADPLGGTLTGQQISGKQRTTGVCVCIYVCVSVHIFVFHKEISFISISAWSEIYLHPSFF